YNQSPYYLFPKIEESDVTAPLENALVFAPFSIGLSYDEESDEIYCSPLLTTSASAFSKKNVTDGNDYEKREGDIDGPFAIALEAEKANADGVISKAYVVGGETLFTVLADDKVPGNNLKLFVSMISALADHESPVAVPVKDFDMTYLVFKAQTAYIAAILCVIVLPLATLLAGLIIWLHRRRR
ncbi:MAG: hypothetical protein K2M22_01415, partial [Lachnospiraceae bacterium]|nr:hypothetical protein [Lachnospiraceae bacterium]